MDSLQLHKDVTGNDLFTRVFFAQIVLQVVCHTNQENPQLDVKFPKQ